MSMLASKDDPQFQDAVQGLKAGDFSRLAPLFNNDSPDEGRRCPIIKWYEAGLFADEQMALDESLACACFLGCTTVVEYLLAQGIDLLAGDNTWLNGFHWAANRGQLETVRLLIRHKAPLETRNRYGGTVLGTAVWAAIHEPKPDHLSILEMLINAGARLDEVKYPTGDERVDEMLRRHGEHREH